MHFRRQIALKNLFVRATHWEYWPFGILQLPAMVYWLWASLRARSPVFFSAANPGIPMGGMFGESKYEVLVKIPKQYVPITLIIHPPATRECLAEKLSNAGLQWPLIFKPDIGERGFLVQRIENDGEMESYIENVRGSFLVQECVLSPLEFGVFYIRMPGEARGSVTSLVEKEMLSVIGDGRSSLQDLILAKPRARLQWKKLEKSYGERLHSIVPAGEKVELVSIGNHALGTRFINAGHLINNRLSETFDAISQSIPGFFFGRFDLRCYSLEDLYTGKVKILELNGCGAEPGHIYDMEKCSLRDAFTTPIVYWRKLYHISRANHRQGIPYARFREALSYYRKFKSAVR